MSREIHARGAASGVLIASPLILLETPNTITLTVTQHVPCFLGWGLLRPFLVPKLKHLLKLQPRWEVVATARCPPTALPCCSLSWGPRQRPNQNSG